MKAIVFIVLLGVSLSTAYAQSKISRIKGSNYFSDQNHIFYVVSNQLNSSGIVGILPNGIDELELIANGQQQKNDGQTAVIMSNEEFLHSEYSSGRQFFEEVTIAIQLDNLSLENVEILSNNFLKAQNEVYWRNYAMPVENIAHFQVLIDGDYKAYSHDSRQVFFGNIVLPNAKPNEFERLPLDYSKDGSTVYHNSEPIAMADPNSFEVLSYTYQKDKNHVWIIGKKSAIDVNTFKILEYQYPEVNRTQLSLYAYDKNHVYFQGNVIPNADPTSFKLLCSGPPYQLYAIDENQVYYFGEALEADVNTFEVITTENAQENYTAQDRDYYFSHGTKKRK